MLQFTVAVTAITDRLDSTTNKTDKAIGSHEKSVNELTNRVAKQSVEINALRDRVALLENQLKGYASSAKKIETWEKDFSATINAAVKAAVQEATAKASTELVVSSTKVPKGTKVSIAEPPIVTSLKVSHSTLATPTRNPSLVKSGLSQKITSSSLTIPDPLRRTTLDNVAQVPHYPQNLNFPVRPAPTPAKKIPAVGDDTPFVVRPVGTQGRPGRVLPGRGRLSTADSSTSRQRM